MRNTRKITLLAGTFIVGVFSVSYFFIPPLLSVTYSPTRNSLFDNQVKGVEDNLGGTTVATLAPPPVVVTHLSTPKPLKSVYMTACYASMPSLRAQLVKMIETTELNAVVIDVKDFTGTISYTPENDILKETKGVGCVVKDMRELIASLHEKSIYVIARVTVFQDPYYTKKHPELAVKRASNGTVWKDYKGLSFIDVSAEQYWEYITALALDAYAIGFDEINFDYIRFPSDGNMKDITYPWSKNTPKGEALEKFFAYLKDNVKPSGAVISADLFGMTTTNTDDLNIGQVLERAMPYFDYVAPMVYPSHYPPNFNGWKNPNNVPYELIKFVMSRGANRATATTTPVFHLGAERIGTSTPALYIKDAYERDKLRPWLQDFDYGGNYGEKEVRAQIQATYDAGLTSWMLWDPSNKYTPSALGVE